MKNNYECAVGHDRDSGCLTFLIIVMVIIMLIVCTIVFVGAIIGAFHSIKNYILSFKENVIDSNRATA